jgi:N-acetylneuraminic acid mutarotase
MTGLSIWDETDKDDGDRTIGNGNISMRLDKKLTAAVWGLDGNEALRKIIEIKGWIDCKANPCLCNGEWVTEPSMNIARDQFAGGVIDGKIYVFGGNGNPGGVNLNSTAVYDPATKLWTKKADNEHNGGEGVEELTSAVVDGKLYVFGAWGGNSPDGYYGDFNFNEMYDPDVNTWTTLAEKPTIVTAAPATVYNGEIYLFGGSFNNENPSKPHAYYKTVEAYNPSDDTWRYVTDMPKTIFAMAVATVGTKAYLFGGVEGGTEPPNVQIIGDIITYDFETKTWTTSGYEPLPMKKGFVFSGAAPVIDGKVYLIGGMEKIGNKIIVSKRVDIYDTGTNTWSKGPDLPKPWDDFVSAVIGQKIYVLGGGHTPSPNNVSLAEVISLDTQACSP